MAVIARDSVDRVRLAETTRVKYVRESENLSYSQKKEICNSLASFVGPLSSWIS